MSVLLGTEAFFSAASITINPYNRHFGAQGKAVFVKVKYPEIKLPEN